MSFVRTLASHGIGQLLASMAASYPHLVQRIKQAKSLGKDASDILKTFEGMSPKELKKLDEQAQRSSNPLISASGYARENSAERFKEKALPIIGAVGAAGLGAMAIPKLAQAGMGLLGSGGGGSPQQPSPVPNQPASNIGPHPMANAPVHTTPAHQANPAAAVGAVPQATQPLQPPAPQTQTPSEAPIPAKISSVIEELGLKDKVTALAQEGKSPEQIATQLSKDFTPDERRAWHKQSIKQKVSLPSVVKDYLTTPQGFLREGIMPNGQTAPIQTQKQPSLEQPSQKLDAAQKAPETQRAKPIKGDIAALPSGEVGEIKHLKNKEALIDDHGKTKKVSIKDLQHPGESVQKAAARLLEIPEIDKSSILSYWAYDKPSGELFVQFHNGESYKYLDVDQGTIDQIADALGIPKTEGENDFGAWSQEDKLSRGATMIQQIISNPKYKKTKKGDPANPNYRKLSKGYDYWSPLRSTHKK